MAGPHLWFQGRGFPREMCIKKNHTATHTSIIKLLLAVALKAKRFNSRQGLGAIHPLPACWDAGRCLGFTAGILLSKEANYQPEDARRQRSHKRDNCHLLARAKCGRWRESRRKWFFQVRGFGSALISVFLSSSFAFQMRCSDCVKWGIITWRWESLGHRAKVMPLSPVQCC